MDNGCIQALSFRSQANNCATTRTRIVQNLCQSYRHYQNTYSVTKTHILLPQPKLLSIKQPQPKVVATTETVILLPQHKHLSVNPLQPKNIICCHNQRIFSVATTKTRWTGHVPLFHGMHFISSKSVHPIFLTPGSIDLAREAKRMTVNAFNFHFQSRAGSRF